ncbi:related to gamma-tubulin complex component 5 [Ustilago trichophora]|uniref:Related to gamma-tubulin complex component 5 n=1 Tax=Ustilago trichophora TaxID=86804 RepID=A0A5C3EAX5_9BASI|nr:related to gamma-tubulin complex component 5 [Ustilago trichophora]
MAPVAGPSSGGLGGRAPTTNMTRTATKSKTNKRIEQERILDRLVEAFLQDTQNSSSSSKSAQKAKAIQAIDKDSWSPADDDEIAAAVQGLALKHSIHLDHELAVALRRCYSQLLISCQRSVRLTAQTRDAHKRRGPDVRSIPDPLLRPDNVADAVRLLLQLSKPADVTARTAANLMLNATQASRAQYLTPEQRKQAEKREWMSILVEEPLEGDDWAEDAMEQDNSDLSDWSLDSDDEYRLRIEHGYDSDKEVRKRRNRLTAVSASIQLSASSTDQFQRRELWTRERQTRSKALVEASDKSVRDPKSGNEMKPTELTEADAVRESLSALAGCSTFLFKQSPSGKISLALSGQSHVLAGLAEQLQVVAAISSTLAALRSFVKDTVLQSIQAVDALTRTPAVEAFAEQLQILLERVSLRLSELDADLAVASMPVRPTAIGADRYATLTQLLEFVLREAASVLLLSRLLLEMGFTTPTDAGMDTPIVGRAFSDRALIDGLQALLGFVHQQNEVAHSEAILADLSICLLAACRPAWKSVCRLIQRGLNFSIIRDHDPLFYDRLVQHMIRHDTSLPTSDSTFWTSGYAVEYTNSDLGAEEGDDGYNPPAFLQSIVQDVVTTAKGVGLLRSLGIDALGEVQPNADLDQVLGLHREETSAILDSIKSGLGGDDSDIEDGSGCNIDVETIARTTPLEAQNRLRQLLFSRTSQKPQFAGQRDATEESSESLPQTPDSQPDAELLLHAGTADRPQRTSHCLLEPNLGRLLREHLSPISAIVRKRLIEVLSSAVTEGGYALQSHLKACHGLFFMQRGAEMTSWSNSLFIDLDRRHGTIRATENHRLNSGFGDALEAHQRRTIEEAWIDPNLVRFSTGDDEPESAAAIRQRTRIRRLADVQVEYEVPWPLTFAFPLGCMRFYQAMFTTLLQARYAQWKLSSTLKLAKPETMHMRKFWALRRQAQWLVRTLIEFLQRDVLLDGSQRLCIALEGTISLDSAIQIHNEALERMAMLCFHRLEQAKVKELLGVAWRLGVEVVSNYEQFIGKSSREEDRQARRKRKERRKKRRDKAKRDGAPLGVIAEEDEEEEEEEEEEEGEDEREEEEREEEAGYAGYGTMARTAIAGAEGEANLGLATEAFDSNAVDASMSVDISASWMESETHKRERFRIECERQRKALHRLVEELKVSIDEQIGRIAAKAAVQAQDAIQADRALQEHDDCREKWQGLLYALAWSDMTY